MLLQSGGGGDDAAAAKADPSKTTMTYDHRSLHSRMRNIRNNRNPPLNLYVK